MEIDFSNTSSQIWLNFGPFVDEGVYFNLSKIGSIVLQFEKDIYHRLKSTLHL